MASANMSCRAVRWAMAAVPAFAMALASGASGREGQEKAAGMQDWRIMEPVAYETVSLFPVLARSAADTSGFITLDEGLASGEVVVAERGGEVLRRTRGNEPVIWEQIAGAGAEVNRLVLVHRGSKPLLLLAGEVVSGGKQDRVIAKDRIVAPGAEPLPLDVFCVERGRWAGGSTQFTAAKMMVHPSVREKAAVDRDQGEVWAAVRGDIAPRGTAAAGGGAPSAVLGTVIAAEAPSESYVRIYGSARVGGSVESYAEELSRRFARATADLKDDKVVGVVVAYGGEVAWADIFASPGLFERYWNKLLRSYCVEAVMRADRREKAAPADAREFLKPLAGREIVESEPSVYRWRQVSQGRYSEIRLETLHPRELVLHWCKLLRYN